MKALLFGLIVRNMVQLNSSTIPSRDTGSFKRHKRFYYTPDLSKACRQSSTKSYKEPNQRYDREHLVRANYLDYSKQSTKQSNYMTNIFLQTANM